MKWIDQSARKPQEHIRVLVYVQRQCTEKGTMQGMTLKERGGVQDEIRQPI